MEIGDQMLQLHGHWNRELGLLNLLADWSRCSKRWDFDLISNIDFYQPTNFFHGILILASTF